MTLTPMRLGDICTFSYGDSLPEATRKPGPIPVYGSNGRVGWHDRAVTTGATIIIGRKGSIGEVHYCPSPCFPIDTTYYVEQPKADLRWLYYALLALDLTKLNKSAAVPGLNRDDAYDKHLLIPPLPEQQRLAALLDKADHLRRTRRYAQHLSDTFLQSVFLEMFGDLTKSSGSYSVELLGEICDVRDGTHDSPAYTATGYPLVTSKNLANGTVDLSEVSYISEIDYQAVSRRSKVDKGDLLMPMIGTIGGPVLVDHVPNYAIKNVALIKFSKKSPERLYIKHLLSSGYFDHITLKANRGGTQKFISLGDIRDFPIPLPPLALQEQFAQVVRHTERLRGQQREAARQAEHLFQTLLARAFRGAV